eukprot:CAMPEP_0113472912 /NCGR_PEP_ID=MMETSP0014_2-20120614/17767_1 /TAXON_ID=2857 /ORGANISM="Nitzschia sp." /LENGTH=305 /DNA_ID=CAMNT_0000365651 /DNA_START=209 /DNA_END=1122 /DNA_ORIENTATION=- /assembly_acc=CAM_ASM_000159
MFGGLFRPSSAPPAPVSEPVSAMESSSSSLSSQPGPVRHQPPIIYRRQHRQCQQRSTASSSSQASSAQVSAVPSNDSTVDRRNLSQSWSSTVKNSGDAIADSNTTVDGDNNSNDNIDDHLRTPALWKRRYIRHHKQPSSKSLPLPQKHQPQQQQQQQQQQEKTKKERRRLRPSSILSLPSSLPGQNHHSSSSFSVSASSPTTTAVTTKPSVFFLAGHPSSKLQREESYRHGLAILTQIGQTTNDAMRRHRGEMMEHDLDILSGLATESTATTTTTVPSITEDHDNENSSYDEYFMSLAGGSVCAG